MGRKVVKISSQLFRQILSEGVRGPYRVTKDALPSDAVIVDVRYNGFSVIDQGVSGTLEIVFESAEFPTVEEGAAYPGLCPVLTLELYTITQGGENGAPIH